MRVEMIEVTTYECPRCGHQEQRLMEVVAPLYCPMCMEGIDRPSDIGERKEPERKPDWRKIQHLAAGMMGALDLMADELGLGE